MCLHQRLRCSRICTLLDRHGPLPGICLTRGGGMKAGLDLFSQLVFTLGYRQRLVMVTSINLGDLGVHGR
jgi:hypothetical protein